MTCASAWTSSPAVAFYARNDHLGLLTPYEYMNIDRWYEPDFLVRLANGATVVLEIKGFEDDQDKAKHTAAKRWVMAVNNWGQLGRWAFMFAGTRNCLIRRWTIRPGWLPASAPAEPIRRFAVTVQRKESRPYFSNICSS